MIETPATIEEAQALLRKGGRLVFQGGGTVPGTAPEKATVIRTTALNRIVEYAPSDQVVTAEGGVTLLQLQRELARHGQRLALDPPFPDRATLGGIVASNSFGPLRTRYGSVRDLIIGISILRADGTRARGGGKVVKTVAGFDLPKLMCGSQGTLGLIATVTFRVHPLPEYAVTIAARALSASGVVELVRKLRALQLEPAAVLATRVAQGWDVALRFEGFRAGVVQQRDKLRDLADAPSSLWDEHLASRGPMRFGALPTQLPQLEQAVGPRASWYPTLGLGFTGGIDAHAARRAILALGGWVVSDGDFGPPPSSLPLHRAVKARMDPDHRLSPGSFVGDI